MMQEIKKNPMYRYLLILVISASVGLQGWRTLFNNFAVDEIGLNGLQVGIIQSMRELPGFLVFSVVFILLIIREHKLSAVSIIFMGIGVASVGFFPGFYGVIITTVLMSIGFHYFETTNRSLTIQYFPGEQSAMVFARLKGMGALANIVVGGLVIGLSYVVSFKYNYLILGILVAAAGVYMLTQNPIDRNVSKQRKKLFLKKEYWLYYMLNFLSGARRQIFVVFAVFMLVEKYNYSIVHVSILFVLNNVLTYFINPYIAKGLNKFGERKMLSVEYIALAFVFTGYAFVEIPIFVALFYIVDHIFFGFAIGINTYLQKIAEPEDIAPSNAVGFAINHITAVFIPFVFGMIWMYNWRLPFIVGAILAVVSLVFVQFIRIVKD